MNIAHHMTLKFGSLFTITLISIILFSMIYKIYFKMTITESVYTSTLIQTLNGKSSNPDDKISNKQTLVISTQSFIAYLITSGLIIISITK